ncbi:MAG TPA: hypothetical protein VGF86_07385 [Candidatus Tumulicola sp.]|jgi:dimethylargininase
MRTRTAIVRPPAANFGDGLTTESLGRPAFDLALAQHAAYCRALEDAGASLVELPPDDRHPDAQFVEDVAVLAPGVAILTRPGAPERLSEVAGIRAPLARHFEKVVEIVAPGTLDGGDVCAAGNRYYVGISRRTNTAGAKQLAGFLSSHAIACTTVDLHDVPAILHFKSGVSYLGDGRFAAIDVLAGRLGVPESRIVRVVAGEGYAANCVRINETVIVAAGYPRLRDELARAFRTVELDVSEFRKMDGGLSCLSLRF